MATAMKCDRCGQYYEIGDPSTRIRGDYGSPVGDSLDICESCSHAFADFLTMETDD